MKVQFVTWPQLFKLPGMKRFAGITIFPFIFLKDDISGTSWALMAHEMCHWRQQMEHWVVGFYIRYLFEFVRNLIYGDSWMEAYRNISYEVEARRAETNLL